MTFPPLGPIDAAVLFGLLVACATDLTQWRIPNALNLVLLVTGFILNALAGHPVVALLGCLVAFAVHFPLWILGVQKGGDAKLMIALGALVGWNEMLETTLWKLLLLIPVGLVVLAAKGRVGNLLTALRRFGRREAAPESSDLTYMPFAPVIAMGWVLAHSSRGLEVF
jgi:Flp pilus assembly protein protease CpaA